MNEEIKIAICSIGNDEFSVPINHVKEIVCMDKLSKIPDLPEYITGMINLRGTVYLIYDLRIKFNIKNYSDLEPKILIMNDKKVGLVVDEVSEIISVTDNNFNDKSHYPDLALKKFISNIVKVNERIIINLDMKNLLDSNDDKIIEEILE